MAERNFTLTLPQQVVDYVVSLLGERPMREAEPVVMMIRRQVAEQMQQVQTPGQYQNMRPRSVEAREAAAAGLEEARLASVAGDPPPAEMLAAE